jgi:hypothetical protein
MPMRGTGRLEVPQQTLALGLTPPAVVVQALSGLLAPGINGLPQGSQVPFGVAHQRDEDFALASTLAAKAAHDLLQGLAQFLRLLTQGLGRRGALARNRLDEAKEFF